ncbi:hypothetical protein BDR26DRAFT_1007315 [Obelidium mucronatum]|nr:hypothetical protein BDR26DRAFT_1007315 [Obelidium mucronatum]
MKPHIEPLKTAIRKALDGTCQIEEDLDTLAAAHVAAILALPSASTNTTHQQLLFEICTCLAELFGELQDRSFPECLRLVQGSVESQLYSLDWQRFAGLISGLEGPNPIKTISNAPLFPVLAELPLSSDKVARLVTSLSTTQAPLSTILHSLHRTHAALICCNIPDLQAAVEMAGMPLVAHLFTTTLSDWAMFVQALMDERSDDLLIDLLTTESILFCILSNPRCVELIASSSSPHNALAPFVKVLDELCKSGISSVLKYLVHGSALVQLLLASPQSVQIVTFRLSILLYHAQTTTGVSELIEYFDSKSFAHNQGVISHNTLFSQLVTILKFCGTFLGTNTSALVESSGLLEMALVGMKLANHIKNSVYDLNLLGVLITCPSRPICQVTKRSPLHELTESIVALTVVLERHVSQLRSESYDRYNHHSIQWVLLLSLSVEILHDMVSIVAYEPSSQLDKYLTIAQRIEVSGGKGEGEFVTRAILPRFFQRISATCLTVLEWLDKHPWDFKTCFELIHLLLPHPSNNELDVQDLNRSLLKLIWTQELGMIQNQLCKAVYGFGFTAEWDVHQSVSTVIRLVLDISTGFELGTEFCVGLGNHVANKMMQLENTGNCIQGEDQWGSTLRWFLILKSCLDFPEGIQACRSLIPSVAKLMISRHDWSQSVGPFMDFLLAGIRSSLILQGYLDPDYVKPLSAITNHFISHREKWTHQIHDFYVSFLLVILPAEQTNIFLAKLRQQPNDWLKDCAVSTLELSRRNDPRTLDFLLLLSAIAVNAGCFEDEWFIECQRALESKSQQMLQFMKFHSDNRLQFNVLSALNFAWSNDYSSLFQPSITPSGLVSSLRRLVASTSATTQPSVTTTSIETIPSQPTVVFKQYSQNSFRVNSTLAIVKPVRPHPHWAPLGAIVSTGPSISRTMSNSSRAPSVHVDTFSNDDIASYQKQQSVTPFLSNHSKPQNHLKETDFVLQQEQIFQNGHHQGNQPFVNRPHIIPRWTAFAGQLQQPQQPDPNNLRLFIEHQNQLAQNRTTY